MNINKRRILVISFSPLKSDPRVYRQLLFLKQSGAFNVKAAGFSDPEIPGVEFIKIMESKPKSLAEKLYAASILKLGLFEKYYWQNESVISGLNCLGNLAVDLIVANDIGTLPLAVHVARKSGAKIVVDCHEYKPLEFDDQLRFRLFLRKYWDYICKRYLPYAHARTTVCESIAEEYAKNYEGSWEVITNAPFFEAVEPTPVKDERIRMVHHGAAHPSRKLEKMIEMTGLLREQFHLDFLLIDQDSTYAKSLRRASEKNPRIKFREPVPMTDIMKSLNEYDIGLCLIWPRAFNYEMSLPNKLFEFVQARLAVAAWPSPEMAKVVRKHDIGVVSDDYSAESVARCVNQLSPEAIRLYKDKANEAAAVLCAERNMEKFNQIIDSLMAV